MNKFSIISIFLVMWIFSCDDVWEEDIRNNTIELRSPSDSLVSQTDEMTFWWNKLDGASQYELLIVSPDIEDPDVLVLDTLVTKNSFTFIMPVGVYHWCVKGVNGGYETAFNCRVIEIEE